MIEFKIPKVYFSKEEYRFAIVIRIEDEDSKDPKFIIEDGRSFYKSQFESTFEFIVYQGDNSYIQDIENFQISINIKDQDYDYFSLIKCVKDINNITGTKFRIRKPLIKKENILIDNDNGICTPVVSIPIKLGYSEETDLGDFAVFTVLGNESNIYTYDYPMIIKLKCSYNYEHNRIISWILCNEFKELSNYLGIICVPVVQGNLEIDSNNNAQNMDIDLINEEIIRIYNY